MTILHDMGLLQGPSELYIEVVKLEFHRWLDLAASALIGSRVITVDLGSRDTLHYCI